METQATVGMTDASGVNSHGATAPVEAPVQDSPTQDQADQSQSQEASSKDFVSRREFNKQMEAARKAQKELNQLKTQSQQYKDAIALDEWLRTKATPQQIKTFIDMVDGKSAAPQDQPQTPADPYAEFAPEVADKFRQLDKLQNYIAQQEQEKQAYEQRSIQENRSHLENVFEKTLREHGYVSKDGTYDQFEVGVIGKAVLAELMEITENPNKPTEEELHKATESVLNGMKALEKRALKKTIRQPGVPPTGSRVGSPPPKGGKESDAQRISRIMAEL